jgi:hypothetical protein
MATQTFACPACGSHKIIDDPKPGEKMHCTCGMSFPASPVFAVANAGSRGRLSGTGWAVGIAAALLIGTAGAAGWLMSRPQAGTPDAATHPEVAEGPAEVQPGPTPMPAPNPRPDPGTPDSKAPPAPNPAPPSPPPTPPAPPATPAITVSAVTLWDAFDLDPTAAAAQYAGKLLEVTGRGKLTRDTFGKWFFGAVVVKPRGKTSARLSPDERRWEAQGYPASVRFYLAPGQTAALEDVPADRDVVIRGTCTGRKDRQDVYRGYIVELENCTAVGPK